MKRSPIRSRSLKSRSVALVQAQAAFNAYIRARDRGLPCISCGEFKELQAGHYRSTSAAPEIRFSEENVNGQCEHCNTTLDGNKPGYRRGILDRYGPASLIMLDSLHMPTHFSASDFRDIRAKYSAMAAELIADVAA